MSGDAFYRFPRTPHLAWLGDSAPREDKLLSREEAREFLSKPVRVEEKVDGANLGLSIGIDGALRAQNRGAYLDLDSEQGQWRSLQAWLKPRRARLESSLDTETILFGEWCYAIHSVHYTRLPDWFLVFDVYNRQEQRFWSAARRDRLAAELGLEVVPFVAQGSFKLGDLQGLLEYSALRDGPPEGLYLRQEDSYWLIERAKLVRSEFVESIGAHWSRRPLRVNQLSMG